MPKTTERTAVPAERSMDLDTVAIAHDDQCDLGKRIYGDGQGCCSGYPEYGRLRDKHADFHKCAAGDGDWAEF